MLRLDDRREDFWDSPRDLTFTHGKPKELLFHMSDLNQDRLLSHGVLNYLSSVFQGRFAALNFLSAIKHPACRPELITRTQQVIATLTNWVEALYKNEILLSSSWSQPETFEAKNAVDLLDSLRPELKDLAAESRRILQLPQLPSAEELGLLVSFIVRSVYSRDAYLRGFIEYGKNFNLPDMVAGYESLLPRVSEERLRVEQVMEQFRKNTGPISQLPPDFLYAIHSMAGNLPTVFRTQFHDVIQLIAPFKGGMNFSLAEFDGREATAWQSFNIGPVQAGYWRAHGFEPEAARNWLDNRIGDPAFAADWAHAGFTGQVALPWIEARFAPDYARVWASAGYTPEQAIRSIERGIRVPGGTPEQNPEQKPEEA